MYNIFGEISHNGELKKWHKGSRGVIFDMDGLMLTQKSC